MANEDYHEMEMSRRSIKINTIRQELEDASEREQEAQERLAQLDRQIQEKKVHVVVFKQNAQGMEDQAAASEAFCLQNHRLMKEDEEDVRSEAEALNEKLAKTARSLEKAQADAIQAQRAAEAQEEAKKRQAEETAKHAAQLATLEATMAAATADVESIQETIRELEVTLEMEKKTGKELQDSVNAEEEKRQETQLECDRLMHFLESLSSRGNKEELSKALAAMQREHSQLQQELITKKTNVLIKQQEIRGRLDETRRIHEERKVSAADVAAIALNASGPIAALTVTLEEERRKAEAARETRLQLEAEVEALEKQLAESPKVNLQSAQRPTEPTKCENDQSGQEVRADSSGSSSPTFSDSANLSELLRSTSAMARSEGMSSGSRSPMVVVTQPLPAQAAQGVRTQGAQETVETVDDEPICAFSSNVSEDGFRSGDELNLP